MRKSNRPINFRFLLVGFCLCSFTILFTACRKEQEGAAIEAISLPPTNGNIYSILVSELGRLYFVGGDRLTRNDFFESDDLGQTWRLSHFDEVLYANKAIFCLTEHKGAVYGGSFDGKVFKQQPSLSDNWSLGLGHSWWYSFTGISFNAQDFGFAVGNSGFGSGLIVKFDANLETLQIDSFPFALNDILMLDAQEGYAVGYGALLQTLDGGNSWSQLSLTDDNYRALAVDNRGAVWTVGFNGTIAKITNQGRKIKKVKNGQNPLGNTDRYLDIAFKDEVGYIVGEKGVVQFSTDGGASWKKMKKFTHEDINAVAFHPHLNIAYFGGSNNLAYKLLY
jgi:photosystem II stability/assembly factor-like uncharacterized protein